MAPMNTTVVPPIDKLNANAGLTHVPSLLHLSLALLVAACVIAGGAKVLLSANFDGGGMLRHRPSPASANEEVVKVFPVDSPIGTFYPGTAALGRLWFRNLNTQGQRD